MPPKALTQAAMAWAVLEAGLAAPAVLAGRMDAEPTNCTLESGSAARKGFDTVGTHAAIAQIDIGQFFEFLQARDACVGDLRAIEIHHLQLLHAGEHIHAGVRGTGASRFSLRMAVILRMNSIPRSVVAFPRDRVLRAGSDRRRCFSPSSVTMVSRRRSRRRSFIPARPCEGGIAERAIADVQTAKLGERREIDVRQAALRSSEDPSIL